MLGAYIGAEVNNPNCPWGGVYEDATLTANKAANRAELDRAIAWANRYADIVDVVSVGNEATVDWTDHLIEPETVKAYASDVRSQIKQPVTFCENYVPWLTSLRGSPQISTLFPFILTPFGNIKHSTKRWITPEKTLKPFKRGTPINRSSLQKRVGPRPPTVEAFHRTTSAKCFNTSTWNNCFHGPRSNRFWSMSLKPSMKIGKDRIIP